MKRVLSTGDINGVELDNNCNDMFMQVRGQRKKSKRAAAKSQPVQNTITTAATAVTGDKNHSSTSVSAAEMSQLQKSIDQLSAIIQDQQATICNLNNKLIFVLSFLDIADDELVSGVAVHNTAGSHVAADTGATSQHMSQPINQSGRSDGSTTTTTTTYAGVTASNRIGSGIGQNSNLREAVAAAVFADQRDKERRSKSIIVSGLNSSGGSSDSVSFQRLCMLELGIEPVITYTRRLGHADGSRVRPLLVGLQSADEARQEAAEINR